jgi:glycine/D-amino acid oxidase-like deaminating enzyme
MHDYLIVGAGLAGIAFAEHALARGRSVVVFEDDSLHASSVAAGVYNPVVLKRLQAVSGAQIQLDKAERFFSDSVLRLGRSFRFPMPVLRRFASVEEQNDWFASSDRPALSPFLSPELEYAHLPHVRSPFHFGRVMQTGFVDAAGFVSAYRKWLAENGMLCLETIDYGRLNLQQDFIRYKEYRARHIVFADGFGIRNNPFFNYLPLAGTKGELLIIRAPELKLDKIVKTDIFILPAGNDRYRVGATYNWDDKTENPTPEARRELETKLRETIDCGYEVIGHQAAIRPTVKDRKALIGTHPEFSRIHLLNGLGTRGVMLAPSMAEMLIGHIEDNLAIDPAVNLRRFLLPPADRNG